MLSKAIKHEFRATSRVMVPIFIAMVLLTIATFFSLSILKMDNPHWLLTVVAVLTIVLFVLGLIGALVGVIILSAKRFHRSFLSDEGYLNMTLPMRTHSLISSRLIVSAVWYILVFLAILFSALVLVLSVAGWNQLMTNAGELWQMLLELRIFSGWSGALLVAELIVGLVLTAVFTPLLLYAAMAVGHSFTRHKKGFSVLFGFAFYHAVQLINTVVQVVFLVNGVGKTVMQMTIDSATFPHTYLGITLLSQVILCVGFYLLTHYFLSKKLNLE